MSKKRIQARNPKGMRDFLPDAMIKREYVFDIVREAFHTFGFEPLQTPVLELQETLLGNYGQDAEKLIFHAQHPQGKEELALRYDLTVPLARVVAQYTNEITFPFKRYQLSPVWRAERPQRGRYREFYQCDADIVGVDSMSADAEVITLINFALTQLGFRNYTIKINNRKLLTGIGIYSGVPDEQLGDLYRSIDKFDKVGASGVEKELLERGIKASTVERLIELVLGDMDTVQSLTADIPEAVEGINELRELMQMLQQQDDAEKYQLDFTMVRGLGYYTGPIFEAIHTEPNLGSITGGGRYDQLIGLFRNESLPTVGMSLGIERIIDIMDELDLYPENLGGTVVQALVTVFDESTREASADVATKLRNAGIHTELILEDRKLGKQFNYADKKGIPLVVVLGPNEIEQGIVRLKRLSDGTEVDVKRGEIAEQIRHFLN